MFRVLTMLRRTPASQLADPLDEAERAEAAALAARADAERRATLAAAAVSEADAAAKIAAIEHRARLHAEERDRLAAAKRLRDEEAARVTELAATRSKWRDRGDHARTLIAEHSARVRRLVVNIAINSAAGYGQYKFFTERAGLDPLWAVVLAAGLELVAVTVLDYGLTARRKGHPWQLAFGLSALLAVLVAAMNYSHWSSMPNQQALAVGFALLSLMSPVLWAWYVNARNAETARVLGRDARASRSSTLAATTSTAASRDSTVIASFSFLRWLFWLPQTFAAKRQAVRWGLSNPDAAVTLAEEHLAAKQAARQVAVAARASKRAAQLAAKQQQKALPQGDGAHRGPDRYLPTPEEVEAMTTDHEKRASARDAYRIARQDGVELTGPALAAAYTMSPSWARQRIREAKKDVVVLRGRVEVDDSNDGDEDEGEGKNSDDRTENVL